METRRDSIEMELEAMMMRAPFAELTPDERKGVIALLGSMEVYERMRAALLAAHTHLSEDIPSLAPRAGSLDALHAAMRGTSVRNASSRRRGWLADLLSYRIPLYQPVGVVALLAVIVGVYFAGRGDGMRERIVYLPAPASEAAAPVVQIDTEAIVQRVVDSLKEEFARSAAESSPARAVGLSARGGERRSRGRGVDTALRISTRGNGSSPAVMAADNRFVGLGNMPQLDRQRRGKSIAEDSALGRFRSKVALERL